MIRWNPNGMQKEISFATANIYLNKLKSVLYIKIPNGVKSSSFFAAVWDIFDGDGFIDTEKDSRGVEHEEHEDGEDKNQGKVGICLLMMQSFLTGFVAWKIFQ